MPRFLRFLLLVWMFAAGGAFAADAPPRRLNVLYVGSYSKDLPVQVAMENGLNNLLSFRSGRHNLYFEFLESERLPQAEAEKTLGEVVARKYASVQFDAVVGVGASAALMLARHRHLFPGARRIYADLAAGSVAQITAADDGAQMMMSRNDLETALEQAVRLSGAKTVYVVGESQSKPAEARVAHFREAAARLGNQVSVTYWIDEPLDALLTKVASLPKDAIIYYLLLFNDGAGGKLVPYEAAARLAERASAPIFSHWESLMGSGVVGGYAMSAEKTGEAVAQAILTPENPPGDSFRHVYDWRQLKRWGLDQAAMPAGSLILFRQPSVVDQYRWQILGAGMTIVALSGLLAVLARVLMQRNAALRGLSAERAALADRVRERTEDLSVQSDRLAEALAFNKQVISEAPVGILVYRADGQCMVGNEFGARVMGTELAGLLAGNFRQIETWRGSGLLDACFTALTGGRAVRHEVHQRTEDGREAWLDCRIVPLTMHGLGHLLVMFTDVTEQKTGEAALVRAREAAEAANRAKSDFLANMSHEIRTPMNAILGLSQILERTALSAEQRDCIGKIAASGRSLLSILNDILDFSKIEAGRLELEKTEFRLDEVLSETATIMSVNASAKDVEVLIAAEPQVPKVLVGDSLRLQQVLINLTGNAIKFTRQGEVVVRAEVAEADEGQVTLRFTVRDTGIGIDQRQIAELFSPFTQADASTTRRYGGTGLGLAICKRLVTLMGGEIGAESVVGQGSTFWFTVRLDRPSASSVAAPTPLVPELRRVLVVDDHETARDVLAATCARLGWPVVVAGSGPEALAAAEREPFDLVLMDWQMPGMDGVEACRALRALPCPGGSPLLLMVTAHGRDAAFRAVDQGLVHGIVTKPLTAPQLAVAVTEARNRRADRAPAPTPEAACGHALSGISVLVVEDSPINQEVARKLLEMDGALVTVAADGIEAVNALRHRPKAFDVVLMDVQMPVLDGFEATRRIRQELKIEELPIIALTAGVLPTDQQRCTAAGMDDFLAKPFEAEQLIATVRRHAPATPRARETAAPPPSPVAAGQDLPDALPGIDLRQALLRTAQDKGLLRQLLVRLVSEFETVCADLRHLLDSGEEETAARLMHRLRGSAGNVGAMHLARTATTLEAAIKDGRGERIAGLLTELGEAAACLPALKAALVAPAQAHGGDEITAEDVETLKRLLAAGNLEAADLYERLRPGLAARLAETALARLDAAMAALDARAALGVLHTDEPLT